MLPFRKIVFPVDYSDSCVAVAPYVKELTQRFDAQLTLVHAYLYEVAFADLALADPKLPEEMRRAALDGLRGFATDAFPAMHVEISAQFGDAAGAIKNLIEHEQADLVMLPTQGRGVIRRMLLGSVAAKVLHDVDAAVWTATPEALTRAHAPYRTVLCACDVHSPEAEVIMKAAVAIAGKYNAKLSLTHVTNLIPVSAELNYADYQSALNEAASVAMRELKAKLGINAPHNIVEDSIAAGVRGEAIRTQADLVVTGRGHQQGAISRAWSNLYEIVRETPCPVISI